MKRLIMTMVMAVVMSLTVSAQRINNTIKEARILTDKMVEELNLNNWQREKAYQMNLDYLNGINGRNDIHSQIWSYRNTMEALQEGKLFLPANQLEKGSIRT